MLATQEQFVGAAGSGDLKAVGEMIEAARMSGAIDPGLNEMFGKHEAEDRDKEDMRERIKRDIMEERRLDKRLVTGTKFLPTPLEIAAQNGHFEVATLLIETARDLGAMQGNNLLEKTLRAGHYRALTLAAERGNHKVVSLLMEEAKTLNDGDTLREILGAKNFEAFHAAIKGDDAESLKRIMEAARELDDDTLDLLHNLILTPNYKSQLSD